MSLPHKILNIPVNQMEEFLDPPLFDLLNEIVQARGYDSILDAKADLAEDRELEQTIGGLLEMVYEPEDEEEVGS